MEPVHIRIEAGFKIISGFRTSISGLLIGKHQSEYKLVNEGHSTIPSVWLAKSELEGPSCVW